MNARNASIIQARASGRPLQSIAVEHGLSVARVSKIVGDHKKDIELAACAARIAELEAEVARLKKDGERARHDAWKAYRRMVNENIARVSGF